MTIQFFRSIDMDLNTLACMYEAVLCANRMSYAHGVYFL